MKAVFAAIRTATEKEACSEADVLAAYSKVAVFLDEIVQEVRAWVDPLSELAARLAASFSGADTIFRSSLVRATSRPLTWQP